MLSDAARVCRGSLRLSPEAACLIPPADPVGMIYRLDLPSRWTTIARIRSVCVTRLRSEFSYFLRRRSWSSRNQYPCPVSSPDGADSTSDTTDSKGPLVVNDRSPSVRLLLVYNLRYSHISRLSGVVIMGIFFQLRTLSGPRHCIKVEVCASDTLQ